MKMLESFNLDHYGVEGIQIHNLVEEIDTNKIGSFPAFKNQNFVPKAHEIQNTQRPAEIKVKVPSQNPNQHLHA